MIKIAINKNNLQMTHDQINELAGLTEGYSGSDIANLTNDALMTPVRTLDKVRVW